jgi:hypothetical protein
LCRDEGGLPGLAGLQACQDLAEAIDLPFDLDPGLSLLQLQGQLIGAHA